MPRTGRPSKRIGAVRSRARFSAAIIEGGALPANTRGLADSDNAAMDETDFDASRTRSRAPVAGRKPSPTWPAAWLPGDLAEAYRFQAAVARDLGAIGGWKVAAVTPAQRESLGVPPDRGAAARTLDA